MCLDEEEISTLTGNNCPARHLEEDTTPSDVISTNSSSRNAKKNRHAPVSYYSKEDFVYGGHDNQQNNTIAPYHQDPQPFRNELM